MNIKPPKNYVICCRDRFKTIGVADSELMAYMTKEDYDDNYEAAIVIEHVISLEIALTNSLIGAIKKGAIIYIKKDKAKWMEIDGKEVGLISVFDICAIKLAGKYLSKNDNKKEEQSELSIFTPEILGNNVLVDNTESIHRYNSDQSYYYGKVIAKGDTVDWDIKIGDKVLFHENYVINLFVNRTNIKIIDSDNIIKQNED